MVHNLQANTVSEPCSCLDWPIFLSFPVSVSCYNLNDIALGSPVRFTHTVHVLIFLNTLCST